METIFDLPAKKKRLAELEEQLASPDAWSDPDLTRTLNQEKKPLEMDISEMEALIGMQDEADTMLELAEEESDESLIAELEELLVKLARNVQDQEMKYMLSGEERRKKRNHHHQFRCRRHRVPGLGGYAAAYVPALRRKA